MFEFRNVSDVAHGVYIVNRTYGGVNNSNGSSIQAPVHNQVVGVVRGPLASHIAAVRQRARDVGNVTPNEIQKLLNVN